MINAFLLHSSQNYLELRDRERHRQIYLRERTHQRWIDRWLQLHIRLQLLAIDGNDRSMNRIAHQYATPQLH